MFTHQFSWVQDGISGKPKRASPRLSEMCQGLPVKQFRRWCPFKTARRPAALLYAALLQAIDGVVFLALRLEVCVVSTSQQNPSPTISHSSPAHRQPDSTASIVCGLFLQKGPFKALGMIPATDEDVRDNPYNMSSTRLSYFNWPEHCYLQAWIKLKLHFSISDFQIKLHVVYFLTVPISQKWSNRLSEKGCQTTTRPNGPTDSSPSRHQSRLVLGLMQLLHPSFSVYLPFLAVFFWNWN